MLRDSYFEICVGNGKNYRGKQKMWLAGFYIFLALFSEDFLFWVVKIRIA